MGKRRPDMAARLARAHREARDEAIRASGLGELDEVREPLEFLADTGQGQPQERDFDWPPE
jgi:hypothetical protein